jgi:hypothetical protein
MGFELLFFLGMVIITPLLYVNFLGGIKQKQLEVPEEKKALLPPPSEDEPDIKLEHKEKSRKEGHSEWTNQFYALLPEEEHPDYLEPHPSDEEGDGFTQRAANGAIVMWVQNYSTKDGEEYVISGGTHLNTVTLTHGTYTKVYSFEQWEEYKKRRKRYEIRPDPTTYIGHGMGETRPKRFFSEDYIESVIGVDPEKKKLIKQYRQFTDSDEPGNCLGCGKFKTKNELGFYICKDAYYRKGMWEHK